MMINKIKKIIIGLFLIILIPSLAFAGADFIPSDTDDLPEGSTNQYYTSARALSSTGATSMTENYIPKKGNSGTFTNGTMYDISGNVGIGTTSPSSKLDVVGAIKASTTVGIGACTLTQDADGTCDAGTKIGEDNSKALCMVCI
jgi:hypothetical protein